MNVPLDPSRIGPSTKRARGLFGSRALRFLNLKLRHLDISGSAAWLCGKALPFRSSTL
jgi:hypothetical protein